MVTRSSSRRLSVALPSDRPGTLTQRAGIHPKVVSGRLGHATISITFDTHSRPVPAMQEEAVRIAARVFAD